MKILVSDLGGVLYSFDKSLNAIKHQLAFDRVMDKLGLNNADIKEQLEGEWRAINNGLLNIYPIDLGVENLTVYSKICKIVIISTSLVKTSEYCLKKLGIDYQNYDVYDMSDFGSKKDKKAWKEIFRKYESVDYIVEDGEKNLEAASEAAKDLGFEPKLFTEMPAIK